jgi:hypothetical protein
MTSDPDGGEKLADVTVPEVLPYEVAMAGVLESVVMAQVEADARGSTDGRTRDTPVVRTDIANTATKVASIRLPDAIAVSTTRLLSPGVPEAGDSG